MGKNQTDGVTGNCLIRCDHCGKSFAIKFNSPQKSIVCRACGCEISLDEMRPVSMACDCGTKFRLKTNSKEPVIWNRCHRCRAVVESQWNAVTKTYEPKKKPKTPTYNMTYEQLAQAKETAARNAIDKLLDLTLGLPAMVLMDKHHFGKIRLERFVGDVWKLYEEYEEGRLTLEDIQKTLWEEGGLRIEKIRKK